MADDGHRANVAGGHLVSEANERVPLGAAGAAALRQHGPTVADLRGEMLRQRRRPRPATAPHAPSPPRATPAACALRACRGGANTGRRAGASGRTHRRGRANAANIASVSVGKPGDEVGAEHDVGPQRAAAAAQKREASACGVAALHALEDQVVAGLQREMQVRHQPRLLGEGVDQVRVDLDAVDATTAAAAAAPERWRSTALTRRRGAAPRQVGPVGGEVDAGQHHLRVTGVDQRCAAFSTTSPTGTEREAPRPNGMMQKVQR